MTQRTRNWVVAVAILSSLTCLLAFATSIAFADGPFIRSPAFLVVYDAKGKLVGNVFSVAAPTDPLQSVVTALKVGKRAFFALQVFRDHFAGNVRALFFESPDCSGSPFVITADQANALTPVVAVSRPGSTVYLADPRGIPHTITVGSELAADGTCTIPTDPDGAPVTQSQAIPAIPVIDLNTVFTPPFSVY